ncbi:hypothetical protein [Rhizorhabdus wittichii]|nr:hypothetical protein [Rhizorhabdus wittichii]
MSGSGIFFGVVALLIFAAVARIARDVSVIADMMHDEQERHRHG